MLQAYVPRGTQLERHEIPLTGTVPEEAVWLDLVNPAPGEDKMVEQLLGIAVPTREEMQEIEVSSRLYVEHHARFMTATLMCNSDTAVPKHTAVTFILAKHRLVTVRYEDPRPFTIVGNKLTRVCPKDVTGETVLMDLLDAVIDREADLLASCYRNSLALAREHGIKTIAFPAISCGVYRYPLEQAVAIAVRETANFVAVNDNLDKIIFACFGTESLAAYMRELARL